MDGYIELQASDLQACFRKRLAQEEADHAKAKVDAIEHITNVLTKEEATRGWFKRMFSVKHRVSARTRAMCVVNEMETFRSAWYMTENKIDSDTRRFAWLVSSDVYTGYVSKIREQLQNYERYTPYTKVLLSIEDADALGVTTGRV